MTQSVALTLSDNALALKAIEDEVKVIDRQVKQLGDRRFALQCAATAILSDTSSVANVHGGAYGLFRVGRPSQRAGAS